jgi:3-methyladenine DNA glycosylase AlkD
MSKSNILLQNMLSRRDESQVAGLMRFFKTGPGQYGEGDKFLGIKVPVTRAVVKECWKEVSFENLQECILSPWHEVRLASLLCLVEIFSRAGKKKQEDLQKRCVDFYLANTDRINNWDLVDLSCYSLLGEWLLDKDRSLLYELARNGKNIWERRIGIVSTMAFVRKNQLSDTYSIADIFLEDSDRVPLHDLLQKAVGWLLREAGKKDEASLRRFLDKRASKMPRTMLRYSIEKFPEPARRRYLSI